LIYLFCVELVSSLVDKIDESLSDLFQANFLISA